MNPTLFGEVTLGVITLVTLILVAAALAFAVTAVVLRVRNAKAAARWAGVEVRWERYILDVLDGEAPSIDLIRSVDPSEAPFLAAYLARFVRRVTGPERQRLIELARPLLPSIRAGARSRSPETRASAVDTLGLLTAPEDSETLVAALDDPSPLVAMVAARAIAREGTGRHGAAMVAHLHRFQEWRPSYLAAMLAAFGPAIAPELRAAVADRTRPLRVRTVACDALARLNDADSAPMASAMLEHETDPELLAAALRLLARVGHPAHLPAVRALCHSPDEPVRLAAVRALAALGDARDVDLLVESLRDPSRWVAEHAARGLAAGAGRITLASYALDDGPGSLIAKEALQEPGA